MLTLKGEKVYLRALEPEDLDFLFAVENDEEFWKVSATSTPFSRYMLKQYLENSHRDIFEVKQLRLVICENDDTAAGFIDLFDFEPQHGRAAVGILIKDEFRRSKGFGSEALNLLIKYCFRRLELHQVYAHVGVDNSASRILFENAGFLPTGRKKDWMKIDGNYQDEFIYQLINKNVH